MAEGTSQIGGLAMDFMESLDDALPEGARVVGVGLVAEVEFECDGCGNRHTITPTRANMESQIHQHGLFSSAAETAATGWTVEQILGYQDDDG